jgi:hypothetical protein
MSEPIWMELTSPAGKPARMTLGLADKSQSREQYSAWLRSSLTSS